MAGLRRLFALGDVNGGDEESRSLLVGGRARLFGLQNFHVPSVGPDGGSGELRTLCNYPSSTALRIRVMGARSERRLIGPEANLHRHSEATSWPPA